MFTYSTTTTTNYADLGEVFKPKKAGTVTSHVLFILDESSSMNSVREATISGFNEFLATQKQDTIKTKVSLYKFNGSDVIKVYSKVDINEVTPLELENYKPGGMTNLYDAIGAAMMDVNSDLRDTKNKKDRDSIIITILTDGNENCSRIFNADSIKTMVKKAEGKNWAFMFLGANIDAFAVGGSIGFSAANTLSYSVSKMQDTMNVASTMASRMKTSRSVGNDITAVYMASAFSDKEREEVA